MPDVGPKVLWFTASTAAIGLTIDMATHMGAAGVRFEICALAGGGDLAARVAAGTPVHVLGDGGLRTAPLAVARLRRLVRVMRPDVVHENLFVPALVTSIASSIPGPFPPVLLTRHHDRSHHLLRRPIHVRVDRWTAGRATLVIAPTAAVRETLVRLEHTDETKVRVVNHGLDWTRLTPSIAGVAAWKERLGPGPWAVTASRLDPMKGLDDLFDAFALARGTNPSLRLAVAGGGGTPGAMEATARLARTHGLGDDSVRLLGHVDDVTALMAAADVYVQASVSESFGLSVLEAIGGGTPVAVTTPGGVGEIVGAVQPPIAPGDVEGLAARIRDVVGDPTARARAGAVAGAVRARFDVRRMVEEHAELYRELAARDRRDRGIR